MRIVVFARPVQNPAIRIESGATRVLEEFGRSHARAFLVAAEANEREFPGAWGRTVKEAERWAAHEALLVLEENGER